MKISRNEYLADINGEQDEISCMEAETNVMNFLAILIPFEIQQILESFATKDHVLIRINI